MNPTTVIKAAITELNGTINTLSRFFPEDDKGATLAMLSATTARAHLRDALEAAALASTQPNVDHLADTPSPATATPKRQTTDHPFFPCNARQDPLFSVREGVPMGDALEQASCFLDSAQAIAYKTDEASTDLFHAAGYLIELAKGVVDATVRAIHAEEMGGAK